MREKSPKKPIVKYLQPHILSVAKVTHRMRERSRKSRQRFLSRSIFHIFHHALSLSLSDDAAGICKPLNESANFSTDFDLFPQWQQDGETGARLLHNDFSSFGGFADFALERGSVSSAACNSLGQLFFCLIRLIGAR